jgi:hypothetical protein
MSDDRTGRTARVPFNAVDTGAANFPQQLKAKRFPGIVFPEFNSRCVESVEDELQRFFNPALDLILGKSITIAEISHDEMASLADHRCSNFKRCVFSKSAKRVGLREKPSELRV